MVDHKPRGELILNIVSATFVWPPVRTGLYRNRAGSFTCWSAHPISDNAPADDEISTCIDAEAAPRVVYSFVYSRRKLGHSRRM